MEDKVCVTRIDRLRDFVATRFNIGFRKKTVAAASISGKDGETIALRVPNTEMVSLIVVKKILFKIIVLF